jgi:copper chaperone CopZ
MTTTLVATVGQRFTVTGMTCGHCEMAVAAALSKLEGVTRVDVDLASGTIITESVEALPLDAVDAAVDEAGYELAR